MKRILLSLMVSVSMLAITQQAKGQSVSFNNQTSTYFGGVFLTSCSGTSSNFYYDIPNNYSWTANQLIDENGNSIAASAALGFGFTDLSGGTGTYYVSFCSGGVQQPTGSAMIPAPGGTFIPGMVLVSWSISGSNIYIALL